MGSILIFTITPLILRGYETGDGDYIKFNAKLIYGDMYYSYMGFRRGNYIAGLNNLTVPSINLYSEEGEFLGSRTFSETGIYGGYVLEKKGLKFIPCTGIIYEDEHISPFIILQGIYSFKKAYTGVNLSTDFNYLLLNTDFIFPYRNMKLILHGEDITNNLILWGEFHYTLSHITMGAIWYSRGDLGFKLGITGDIKIVYTFVRHIRLGSLHSIEITKTL